MSVIIAVKENGTIYMGADTQTTAGYRKSTMLNEMGFKVSKLDNGILVGFCGRVASKQTIMSMQDMFTLDEQGKLTKRHIVKEIVPKLIDSMGEIGGDEMGELEVTILLVYKDQMYKITSALDVIHLNEIGCLGAGKNYTYYALMKMKNLPLRERMLQALIHSAKHCESVCGPYVFIDTEKQEFEIIDMGVENH